MAAKQQAEWTVMIYMDVKPPGFDKSLQVSLKEMAFTGSSDKLNIMVLLGRNKPANVTSSRTVYDKPSVYRVMKNRSITIFTKPLFEIENNNNLGDPDVLQQFLQYCKDNYPANRYMLSFWDHGTGSGVEAGAPPTEKAITMALESLTVAKSPLINFSKQFTGSLLLAQGPRVAGHLFRPPPSRKAKNWSPESIPKNNDEEDYLYVIEINDALKRVFKNELPIDIIAFDACWLQMFENGYSLKNSCRYMVASENLISAQGMAYQGFFSHLAADPAAETKAVAAMLINASYLKSGEDEKFTMSCLDLSKADAIAEKISELAELLTNNFDDSGRAENDSAAFFDAVANARFLCLSYFDEESPSGFDLQVVDLVYFLKKLVAAINYGSSTAKLSARVKKLYGQVNALCNDIATLTIMDYIACRQIGCAIAEEKENDKRWGAHGYSILFPEDQYKWRDYKQAGFYFKVGNVPAMPFAKDHKWKAFLEAWYANM